MAPASVDLLSFSVQISLNYRQACPSITARANATPRRSSAPSSLEGPSFGAMTQTEIVDGSMGGGMGAAAGGVVLPPELAPGEDSTAGDLTPGAGRLSESEPGSAFFRAE